MKERINDYVKAKKKEAIIKFLKKHIVGEIILVLVVIGLITLKILKKQISFHLHIAIKDKVENAKNKKKAYDDDGYDDDNEPLAE